MNLCYSRSPEPSTERVGASGAKAQVDLDTLLYGLKPIPTLICHPERSAQRGVEGAASESH